MKKLFFILILLILAGCVQEKFCGTSTYDSCETNNACVIGGCSSQVCQSKDTEPTFTTCEYRECYNAKAYNLECQCIENKCQWA